MFWHLHVLLAIWISFFFFLPFFYWIMWIFTLICSFKISILDISVLMNLCKFILPLHVLSFHSFLCFIFLINNKINYNLPKWWTVSDTNVSEVVKIVPLWWGCWNWWAMLMLREARHVCVGRGVAGSGIWETSKPSAHIAVNLKLLLKIKCILKK